MIEICLSEESIKKYLHLSGGAKNIICLDEVDSTNNYAKKLILQGFEEGTIVTAEKQSAGRGRLGREWVSPAGKGLYMSVVIGLNPEQSLLHTLPLVASIGIAKVVQNFTGELAGIKWPNDIILGNRKVGGLLVEVVTNANNQNVIVLGIGLNVNFSDGDFPEHLKDKATSIELFLKQRNKENYNTCRAFLAASIILELDNIITKWRRAEKLNSFMKEYKRLSVTLGKRVVILSGGKELKGVAQDIADDGRLIIKCDTGEIKSILSGEVSVRGIMGYVD